MEKLDEKVYCHSCKRDTNHSVIYCHTVNHIDFDQEITAFDNYYVVQCRGCDRVGFVHEEWDKSMEGFDQYGEWIEYSILKVYPEEPKTNRTGFNLVPKQHYNVPEILRELYKQTVDACNAKSYFLAAIGLRMIVEGICKDQEITDGYLLDENGNKRLSNDGTIKRTINLVAKINGLVEKGYIVTKEAQILQQIRELGNYTVHEIESPKRSLIVSGIKVIEHIFLTIYDIDMYKVSPKKK